MSVLSSSGICGIMPDSWRDNEYECRACGCVRELWLYGAGFDAGYESGLEQRSWGKPYELFLLRAVSGVMSSDACDIGAGERSDPQLGSEPTEQIESWSES